MGQHIADLDAKIKAVNEKRIEPHKVNLVSQRLAAIPSPWPDHHDTLGKPGKLRERPAFCRLARVDATRAFNWPQASPGPDQQGWQQTVAPFAGWGGSHGGGPIRLAGRQIGEWRQSSPGQRHIMPQKGLDAIRGTHLGESVKAPTA